MRTAVTADVGLWRGLDFELAFLSLLTLEGHKPLSRWEKRFDRATEESLRRLGLKTRVVERSVQNGHRISELLLSSSDAALESYSARFAGLPISHDAETIRFEGRLFGYPRCCVESYANRGYAKNSLRKRDQRILFHWACPGCTATPLLLPVYRRVYRKCRRLTLSPAWLIPTNPPKATAVAHLRPSIALAMSLAVLGILPSMTLPAAADPLDPHVTAFTLYDDPDGDFLLTGEETILGLNPNLSDENSNGMPDGLDLAQQLSEGVDALPTEPSTTRKYVTHHMAFGLENCMVCGEPVNMGFLEICEPLENQTIALPYIAKHYLQHGSFSYAGSAHSGRVNPPLLSFILRCDGHGHLIPEPTGTDGDGDGLRNWEEPAFGTDAQKPDTDGDQLLDGIGAARELRQELEALPVAPQPEDGPKDRPFVVKYEMNGVETCPRCGQVATMGLWEVINPVTAESLTIPTMALHYLDHGAFGWSGGVLVGGQGRIDPRQLQALLTGKTNRHLLKVSPDSDRDWISDQEEANLGKDAGNSDEDRNSVADGLDLARAVACEIAGLPTSPASNRIYRLDFPLRGLEQCEICATNVNMGYVTVCNPQTRLSVDIPYIALHYLEHDSFSYAGDVHGIGRVDVKGLLDTLYRPAVRVETTGAEVKVRWMTRAGRTYQVFTGADPRGPWTTGPAFQGDGTEKVFIESRPDSTSRRFYKVVVW